MNIEDEIQQLLKLNDEGDNKETPRQQHFRILFFNDKEPLSIKKFYEKLKKEEIEEEVREKDLHSLPKFKTFENWSVANSWVKKKREYQGLQNKKVADTLQEEYLENSLEIFRLNQDIRRQALEKAKSLLNLPLRGGRDEKTFSGYQFNQTMQGVKVASEENRLESGNPTQIIHSENNNRNVDVDKTDEIEDCFDKNVNNEDLLGWLGDGSQESESEESDSE